MRIEQCSMEPNFSDGDYVVVKKFIGTDDFLNIDGKVIITELGENQRVIKRCLFTTLDSVIISPVRILINNKECPLSLKSTKLLVIEPKMFNSCSDQLVRIISFSDQVRYLIVADNQELCNPKGFLISEFVLSLINDKFLSKSLIEKGTGFNIDINYILKSMERQAIDSLKSEVYCFVIGDNWKKSKDSRHFGLVKAENIYGEVIYKLSFKNGINKAITKFQ